ncbi:MAG: hypothetical protein RDU14_13310 [Melioribacteraceae bacterium]|nr:hypothetical protein [Melioribacteraceae bacterium]
MKRLLFLSLTSIMLMFISCQNEGPITSPESPPSQKQSDFEPKWIGLPKNDNIKLLKSFKTSEYITKAKGGNLTIDEEYKSGRKNVHTYSDIYFAPGCVKKDGFISMSINDETGITSFLPGQTFNFPAILNQTFTGLNLNSKNIGKIHLYFMNPVGNWEIMECDDLIVDVKKGTITIVNGKLPHFSVFGYGE